MVVAPFSSPAPTPAPTLAGAPSLIQHLQPRVTDYYFSYDTACFDYTKGLQCTNILSGCYPGYLQATNYNEAVTSCYCTYGISYLDCYYSQVATGSCESYYFGTAGYGDFQRSFFYEYCGSIPPSAMAHIQPPTSVKLDLETVDVVTATGAIKQPNYSGQPLYQGTGNLLRAECSQTGFTLVDEGSTVFYAGFMGCIKDRPECCPWAVATATATTADAQDNRVYDFPTPVNNGMAQLASCADDYYSISGGCCPNGFWPFTKEVGGITPCWSSIKRVDPPTLTLAKDAKTKDKPTSAVVNIVWAMRYPVGDPGGGGLSTAAKAGIGAGAGVAAILIGGLAICLWRSRRKNKQLAAGQQAASQAQTQPQQQAAFPQPGMTQQPAVPNGQYPLASVYGPGMLPPGKVPSPSDGASMVSNTTHTTLVPQPGLVPQNTGTSAGGVSELSSQSPGGQHVLHNGQPGSGYFAGAAAANPRVSYASSNGTGSPAVGGNGQGYPAPIAEADEGRAQYQGYGYQHQQQQQQYYRYGAPGQGQGQGHGQGQYYPPPQQHHQQQGGYVYPAQHHQQQQGYPQNVSEMSSNREADPPQEVMGSEVQHRHMGQ